MISMFTQTTHYKVPGQEKIACTGHDLEPGFRVTCNPDLVDCAACAIKAGFEAPASSPDFDDHDCPW